MSSTEHMAENSQKSFRNMRKTYVINPSYQWRYALTVSLVVFLISATMSSVLYGLLHHQARMRLVNPTGYTANVSMVIVFSAVAFAIVTAVGVGFWSILTTHRICGPLYVLHGYFREMVSGKIPNPRALREKDECKELYAAFSEATERLRKQKQSQLSAFTEMLGTVRSLDEGSQAAVSRGLGTVAQRLEDLQKETAQELGCDCPTSEPDNCSNVSETKTPETAGVA